MTLPITLSSVFSTRAAADSGLDQNAVRRLLADQRIARLHHGWYTSRPVADPNELARLRAVAYVRAYAGAAVASGHSAALIRHLPILGKVPARPRLTWLAPELPGQSYRSHQVGTRPGRWLQCEGEPRSDRIGTRTEEARVAAAAAYRLLVPKGGLEHPALTAVQIGMRQGSEAFLVTADAALRNGLADPDQLGAAVQLLNGAHGLRHVGRVLSWCDAKHESPGESRTAFLLRSFGLELEPQFTVQGASGQLWRADFRIKGSRVLVEFDGRVKYADERALWDEKKREDGLRRQGFTVVRVTWHDLGQPFMVRQWLTAALTVDRHTRNS